MNNQLKNLIQQEIAAGYINRQKHPNHDLFILNYSPLVQFERRWNDATMTCRGLIVDNNFNVVARPFKKFFNIQEHEYKVPNEPFRVYEKMDGSLGILYHVEGKPFVATRGSFTSEQSVRANEILKKKYAHVKFNKNYTYLFEIIFPENRIVVNYGDVEDLFLLAVIDTNSGCDVELEDIGFPVVRQYHYTNIEEILKIQDPLNEGFVIKFNSDFRVKVKFEEYCRLHKLLTGINARFIWENLRAGTDLAVMLDRVPDEFYEFVKNTERDLRAKYREIEQDARSCMRTFDSRKETAEYFKTCRYPAIMFRMLDNKDYADSIWKMIEPAYATPFRCGQ